MHAEADECYMLPVSQVPRCRGWSQLQSDSPDCSGMSPRVLNMAPVPSQSLSDATDLAS